MNRAYPPAVMAPHWPTKCSVVLVNWDFEVSWGMPGAWDEYSPGEGIWLSDFFFFPPPPPPWLDSPLGA
jgi:hypothetical protein